MNDNLARVPNIGSELPEKSTKEHIQLDRSTVGFGISFAIVTIFNGILVILKETFNPIMKWMTSLTGHHWITHGFFDIVLFLLLGYIFSRVKVQRTLQGDQLSYLMIGTTVIGVFIIVGFNLVR